MLDKIVPAPDYLLVVPVSAEAIGMADAGLAVAMSPNQQVAFGRIIAVGELDSEVGFNDLESGDLILYDAARALTVRHGGKSAALLNNADVLAFIDEAK